MLSPPGQTAGDRAEANNVLRDPNLYIIFCMTSMAVVGAFSIAPALPRISEDLEVSKAKIGLVMTIFSFPGILLMPFIGVCADRFGRRNVLAASLFLFAAAGSACFFARDFSTLLAFRFLQGIGAAPFSSLNIALIGDMYSGNQRTQAVGYNQAILSVAAASLTLVGGAFALWGWRYPFLLPILGVPIGFLIRFRLHAPRLVRHDHFGVYLQNAWQVVKSRPIMANYIITILAIIVVWGSYISYLPILMALKLKSEPHIIGAVMMTMMIASALTSSQTEKLSRMMSGKTLFKLSFTLYTTALVLMPFVGNPWVMIIPVLLFGMAQGILIPNIQNYLSRYSCVKNRGIVMSVYGSSMRIGQTLGPLIMGLMFPLVGIDGIFFVCAALAFSLVGFAAMALK